MTINQYAKQEIIAGRCPTTFIVPGMNGTFWIEDRNCCTLDGAYMSREAAEKARSKAIDKAAKYI